MNNPSPQCPMQGYLHCVALLEDGAYELMSLADQEALPDEMDRHWYAMTLEQRQLALALIRERHNYPKNPPETADDE